MNQIKNFYNPGALGDIIYCLPFCLSISGIYSVNELNNGEKFNLISDGINLITKDEKTSLQSLLSLKKLLETQPYFNEILFDMQKLTNNEKKDFIDLGQFRQNWGYQHKKDIIKRYNYIYRTLRHYKADDPWIVLNKDDKYNYFNDKIIVFRSFRYRNDNIKNWSILSPYKDKIVYIGMSEQEYKDFNLDVEFYKVKNFLQVGKILNNCRFCIGNQTSFFAIAEALKIPRLVESSLATPDVIPTGDFGNDFISLQDFQSNLKLYMNCFFN